MFKVPPDSLVEHGVPMTRCVQSSREFVLVFSGAYHCNISCGYTLSESVHYASMSWIPLGYQAAKVTASHTSSPPFCYGSLLVYASISWIPLGYQAAGVISQYITK